MAEKALGYDEVYGVKGYVSPRPVREPEMACLTKEGIQDGKRHFTLNIERLARNKVNAYQYTPYRD